MANDQTFTIGGKAITLSKNAVEQAVRHIEPGPIKKYSVLIRGVRYPIKQAISAASGQPSAVFIATDAYRILERLGFQVDGEFLPQVKSKLTLNAIGSVRDGPTFGSGTVFQYRVGNMPPGYQALVTNFAAPQGSDWKIMRIDDDAQEEWNGNYETAEQALAVLQTEFDAPIKEVVSVRIEGGLPFTAEVELRVDNLDPQKMPPKLAGAFTKLPSKTDGDAILADSIVHTDPKNGGASHMIWFHGNRTGYRFRMISNSALDFVAEKI
jgi:hypothetical protein